MTIAVMIHRSSLIDVVLQFIAKHRNTPPNGQRICLAHQPSLHRQVFEKPRENEAQNGRYNNPAQCDFFEPVHRQKEN
jgi:hypothetical protein